MTASDWGGPLCRERSSRDRLCQQIQRPVTLVTDRPQYIGQKRPQTNGDTFTYSISTLLKTQIIPFGEGDKLQDSLEERLAQLELWFENLRLQSNLLQANVRDKVQATIDAAQHSFAELKAQMRTRKREDERA